MIQRREKNMEKSIGTIGDAYEILASTKQFILCRSLTANPVHTYAVMRLDEDGHPFDIRVRAEREAAERAFCSCCVPGWFKNGGTTKTA